MAKAKKKGKVTPDNPKGLTGAAWLHGTIKGKVIFGWCNGAGAAIVIVGALFKIMHWPGSSFFLILGLLTEAFLFILGATETPHLDYEWELVYPELSHDVHEEGAEGHGHGHKKVKSGDPVAQELDKMLEQAKIGPDLLESLGTGMRNLSEQAGKIANITDANVATQSYIDGIKTASVKVNQLAESYVKASESLTGLSNSNLDGQTYAEQLQAVSKNLGALNAVYEMQLQGSQAQLKASNEMYENINELMKNLNDSVEDTRRYKQEISKLSSSLGALNTIYGNMLTAMNYKA